MGPESSIHTNCVKEIENWLPSLLTLSDISSLPSKFHFKAEMLPKRFLPPPTQLSENSVTEITSWTNQWLRKMANRDKYEIDGKKGKVPSTRKDVYKPSFQPAVKGTTSLLVEELVRTVELEWCANIRGA